MSYHDAFKLNVPEGESGDWSVKRFTVSEADEKFGRMRAVVSRSALGRWVDAGDYTGLYRRGEVVMSDTPNEIRDHVFPYLEAKARGGHVLINGLGLGLITAAIARCENVERVTVVEISADVIKLVGPTLEAQFAGKVQIVHADALKFRPGKGEKFSVAWHDIWPAISGDNLPEMTTLHRRYGRRCEWQGSWARELCQRRR